MDMRNIILIGLICFTLLAGIVFFTFMEQPKLQPVPMPKIHPDEIGTLPEPNTTNKTSESTTNLTNKTEYELETHPEGYKGMNQSVYIQNINEFSDYEFILYPKAGGEPKLIKVQKPPQNASFRYVYPYNYTNYKIYAIKKADFNDIKNWTPSADSQEVALKFDTSYFVPKNDSVLSVLTYCNVSIINGKFVLEKTSRAKYYCDQEEIIYGVCKHPNPIQWE